MKQTTLIKRAAIFLLPIILFFAFPTYVLYLSGEFTSEEDIVQRQQNATVSLLVGKSYFPTRDFQTMSFRLVQPNITVIGNSRALQFRDDFFKEEFSFYNANLGGGEVGLLHTLESAFWDIVPEGYNPDIIILVLEQSIFRKNIENELSFDAPRVDEQTNTQPLQVVRKVYLDYLGGKFTLSGLLRAKRESSAIGMRALIQERGTRKDGSERYGRVIKDPYDPTLPGFGFKEVLGHTDAGTQLFKYDTEVSSASVKILEEFLAKAHGRGVHVVAFLPPYAPTVWESMREKGDNYAYIDKIFLTLQESFQTHQFSLFDFTDARASGLPNKEFLDGNHPSEKAQLRLFIKMAEEDPVLLQYVDLPLLKKSLVETKSNLEIEEFEK